MAKISIDLNQFKASGVYILEFDASESIVLNTQTIRLVIGFSRKGPFNAPVYLPDKKSAVKVFGDIDSFLERRGSYFHRALFTALDVAPVFGLNLLSLNNNIDKGDKVPYQSLSLATTERNGKKLWKLYSSFYNKERFWFPSQDYFLGNVNSAGSYNAGKLLNIVNLGQSPVSFIVKKTTVPQFDILVKDFYKNEVPSYLNGFDFISDYFINITVIKGNWTNYKTMSIDPVYKKYFDERGLKKTMINEFLSLPEVNDSIVGSFTGSIIPELIDGQGVNHAIDNIVNQAVATTGIFISIDKEALENYDVNANVNDEDNISAIDMVGHNFADPDRVNPDLINFLSYKTAIKESLTFEYVPTHTVYPVVPNNITLADDPWHTESVHLGKNYGYLNNVVCIPKPVTENPNDEWLFKYNEYKNNLVAGQSLIKVNNAEPGKGSMTATYGKIEQIYEEISDGITYGTAGRTYLKLVWSHPNKKYEKPDTDVSGLKISDIMLLPDGTNSKYILKTNYADLTTSQITAWWTNYNKNLANAGEDILIEDTSNKNYFYLKLAVHPDEWLQDYISDPSLTNYNNSVVKLVSGAINGNTLVGDYVDNVNGIYFVVEGNSVLENIKEIFDTTGQVFSYKIYAESMVNAQLLEYTDDVPSDSSTDIVVAAYPEFIANPDKVEFVDNAPGTPTAQNYVVAYKDSTLYDYFENGAIIPGDVVYYGPNKTYTLSYINPIIDKDTDGITCLKIYFYDTYTNNQFGYYASSPGTGYISGADLTKSDITDSSHVDISPDALTIYGYADKLQDDIDIIANSWNALKTKFQIVSSKGSLIEKGQYIVAQLNDGEGNMTYKLTKVLSKKKVYSNVINDYVYEYETNQAVLLSYNETSLSYFITRYLPLDEFVSYYQLFHLDGFKLTDYHLPGGLNKQAQLEKILGVLDTANTNLYNMLKDNDIIQFRYIVDTFDGGLNTMTYPKTYLTKLAKDKGRCLAFINPPSIKEFISSNNPRFTEEPTNEEPIPILNTRYIADGGNQSLGPAYSFSLPDETNGAKYAAYFAPYLVLRENNKNIVIPPAAHVSNLFIQKFKNGTPFAIVAGTKRGVISDPKLVGLEYDFLIGDREYLEPFGLNPIIKKKGVGYMIFANQLAYQKTRSAFNNIHVRDILITVEDGINELLSNYLFDFNNPNTRLEIKGRIESYLSNIRSNEGIYDFFVVMDESNNPPSVVDLNMGIVDIGIEPVRGYHKFIAKLTVLPTGGVASGNFLPG